MVTADDRQARPPAPPADPDLPWAVVGSGQTSAECAAALLDGDRKIKWMGRRSWFAPLEDSPSSSDRYRIDRPRREPGSDRGTRRLRPFCPT